MPVNARFLAARASERRHRDLAHLRALCWLPLRRNGEVIARTPLVPLTLRHTLELRLARNAFFVRAPILLGDVFVFLWHLHPRRGLPVFWARWRLRRCVRRCDLSRAIASIREFLAVAHQDDPGETIDSAGSRSSAAPDRHAADNLVDWLMTAYSLSHDEALDFPIALGNQLYRERALQQPDGELEVFSPSDALL